MASPLKQKNEAGILKKSLLWPALLVMIAVPVMIVLYGFHLSHGIEKRFAGRRWQLPSRVYSDTTLLYPGQMQRKQDLLSMLYRLDYRQKNQPPARKGEMQIKENEIDLFLNDARLPSGQREGFPVRIRFAQNRIESIFRLDKETNINLLELEPEELTLFFGPDRERRRLVSIHSLPIHLIHAVMAAEDSHFYSHHGISPLSILRALFVDLKEGRIAQGASTITQQLAKNYFLKPERKISRKLKEIFIALIIEMRYKKNEILEMYLNEIYFGQKGSSSVNGIGEAAILYFGKQASELSIVESATIAGLIKGPNFYSPYINPKACKKRRNQVLGAMAANGWLPEKDLAKLSQEPLNTAGLHVQPRKAPYFTDYLYKQLQTLYTKKDLSSLGLSIYTTLDMQVQLAAEHALKNGLLRLEQRSPKLKRADPEKRLQGAVIIIQPRTGYILAMVGGREYVTSQFNRITQARRQPGSAFKPFVCLSALDRFTPASMFSNAPKSYATDKGDWTPRNFEPTSPAPVSMRTALAMSYNRAMVDMAMQTGLDAVIREVRSFGFSTDFKPYPSLALGAFEVVPLELANAYCVFAADGFFPYLLSIKQVVDRFEKPLNRRQISIKRITSPAKTYLITSMLESVVKEGTGRSLSRLCKPFPIAGKTGTTDNFRDAWFVGYTPDILALVWVGFDNGDSIHATGGTAALPIWAELVNSIPQYISGADFRKPPGVVTKKICTKSGLLPSLFSCPEVKEEIFLEGNVPKERCPIHGIKVFNKILKGIKHAFH